jgi:hypothetical protein
MGSVGIIIDPPGLDDPACHWQATEYVFVEAFVAERPLKLSTKALCTGLPGAM